MCQLPQAYRHSRVHSERVLPTVVVCMTMLRLPSQPSEFYSAVLACLHQCGSLLVVGVRLCKSAV